MMAEVTVFLSPMWEIWTEFTAPGFTLTDGVEIGSSVSENKKTNM